MIRFFAIFISFFCAILSSAQNLDTLRIMAYNVENFYYYDSQNPNSDKAFTPEGECHWTKSKMEDKARKIAQVVMAANGWSFPDIVGFEEMGGPEAMDALMKISNLDNVGYKAICFQSPDRRGVTTALIYNEHSVNLLESQPINVSIPNEKRFTRDILYAKFLFRNDTVHILVNHWPSKYGNVSDKAFFRNHVASCTKNFCDSILSNNNQAKIVLIGDFNDPANSDVLINVLRATSNGDFLINLSSDVNEQSYKYQGEWETIDHIIVSKGCCAIERPRFRVCNLPFLLVPDEKFVGDKPFRTYIGRTYNGGYSDHLPVYTEILFP